MALRVTRPGADWLASREQMSPIMDVFGGFLRRDAIVYFVLGIAGTLP
jgi:hypothetical protein